MDEQELNLTYDEAMKTPKVELDLEANKLLQIISPYSRRLFIADIQLKKATKNANLYLEGSDERIANFIKQKLQLRTESRKKAFYELTKRAAELATEYDSETISKCLRWNDEWSAEKYGKLERLAKETGSSLSCPECETKLPDREPYSFIDGNKIKHYCGVCDHNF